VPGVALDVVRCKLSVQLHAHQHVTEIFDPDMKMSPTIQHRMLMTDYLTYIFQIFYLGFDLI